MDAILLRGGGEKPIHTWKKYDLQENVSYTWNRWNLVSTTIYKWNKYNVNPSSYTAYTWNAVDDTVGIKFSTPETRFEAWSSYTYNGSTFSGKGNNYTRFNIDDAPKPAYMIEAGNTQLAKLISASWYQHDDAVEGRFKGYSSIPNGNYSDPISLASNLGGLGSYIGQVTSTSSSAYPSNGQSGSYWYVSAGSEVQYSQGSTQYSDVSSTSSSAYPDDGHDDSYWYNNKQSVIDYSMGNYIEDVFSLAQDTYPANGIAGSYWYVYQGKL